MKKTLEELYTREQFRTVEELKKTMDFKYCPVVFSAFEMVKYGDYTDIRALYLSKVWEEAYRICSSDGITWFFDEHSWLYDPDSYFRKLVFTGYDYKGEVKKFWEALQDVADSGKIKVQEKIEPIREGLNYCTGFEKKGNISQKDAAKIYSWKWEEIKDYFFELPVDMIALLNGEEMNQCTVRDLPLFEACKKGNITKIKKAIKDGANVNAIDAKGHTPVQIVTDPGWFVNIDRTNKIIKLLDLLLSNGADINLYGFERSIFCHDIIHNSVVFSSSLLEYVLSKGAKPIQNYSICDLMNYDTNWKYASSAFQYLKKIGEDRFLWDWEKGDDIQYEINHTKSEKKKLKLQKEYDESTSFYDELEKDQKKCLEILKKAGCSSEYIDGWSEEKVEEYEKQYFSRFDKMSREPVEYLFSKTAIILCGLPSSGKTTFYEQELEQDYPRVEILIGNNDSEMIDEYIYQQKSFVIDGRFITKESRAPVLKKLKEAGYHIICYYLDYTLDEIIEMNDCRAYEERTPVMKIKTFEKTFEKPKRNEGIDALYFVNTKEVWANSEKTKWKYKKIGDSID